MKESLLHCESWNSQDQDKKKTTEILLTSSGHKMQPTEESSAITMKNHSQDISQIWVSLFYPHPITLQAHHLTEVPASHAAFGPGGRL